MKRLLISLLSLGLFLVPIMAENSNDNNTNGDDTKTTTVKYSVSATITFVFQDGEYIYKNIKVGEKLKEPSHEEIEGKKFLGWYNEETGEYWDFNDPIENSMTLVAKYEDNSSPVPSETPSPTETPSPSVSPTPSEPTNTALPTSPDTKKEYKTADTSDKSSLLLWSLLLTGGVVGILVILIFLNKNRDDKEGETLE